MSLYGNPQSDSALAFGALTGRCVRWLWAQLVGTNVIKSSCWDRVCDQSNQMERSP